MSRPKRYRTDSSRERRKEAVTHDRDETGANSRPVRSAWGKGRTLQ
ncbi:hypothetical protein DM2_2769 [Halorubrum sp. DM2]|nr:hypothetical protein DM2_2769 [Halorubrum sp. DM2]